MPHVVEPADVALEILALGAQAQTTLRFGHASSPGEIAHDLFAEFADSVTQKRNRPLTSRVFPSEQLGKEADVVQQVKSGALDICAPSMAVTSLLVPAFEMPSAPFLWRDWKEAEGVIRGPAMEPQCNELRDKYGILPLSKIR